MKRDAELKKEYEEFLKTEEGQKWLNACQHVICNDNTSALEDYLYAFILRSNSGGLCISVPEQNRVLEAVNRVIEDNGKLIISDLLDASDTVIGKFYLSYSDEGYPYIIAIVNTTVCVLDAYKMNAIIIVHKVGNIYRFLNMLDISKSLLIELFEKVSKLVA